jgi:hypothetical protein
MNKEFVPYAQALALKELGFDEPCFGHYIITNKGKIHLRTTLLDYDDLYLEYHLKDIPLYQQAFRWFREKQFMMCYIYYDVEYKFCFCIGYNDKIKGFNTYEEAELACLRKLIEIVKNA